MLSGIQKSVAVCAGQDCLQLNALDAFVLEFALFWFLSYFEM